jgi:two-component system, NarL family, nitrate/nitrite response regulator NarL
MLSPVIATWVPPVEAPPAKDSRTRILIVDDHQIVADALAALLNQEPDMFVAGSAGSVKECAVLAAELSPDIVIVDFRLSDGTGSDAVLAMRAAGCGAGVIFLSRDDGEGARYAAIEAGASAFIHKSRASAELMDAVRTVAAGGSLIDPSAISALLGQRHHADRQRDLLTTREKEILRLMADGTSSREIGSRLGISYTTVRTHVRSLGLKLACHTKLAIILRARELALVD